MADQPVDFSHLLSKPMGEIKKPPALPNGTFHGVITGRQLGITTSDKKTPFVEFAVQFNAKGEDVEEEDMEGIDITKRKMNKAFYLTPDAEYRLKDFAGTCGIDISPTRSLAEVIEDCMNQPVIAEVERVLNKKEPQDQNGNPNWINNIKTISGMK